MSHIYGDIPELCFKVRQSKRVAHLLFYIRRHALCFYLGADEKGGLGPVSQTRIRKEKIRSRLLKNRRDATRRIRLISYDSLARVIESEGSE